MTTPPTRRELALDLIRASITTHEAKADEAHDAERPRLSNEHNAIAAGLRIAEAHIRANPDTELEASQRRAVSFQHRIDAARDWARRNLSAEQQVGLLEALRGDAPKPTASCGSCGARPVTYYAVDGHPACADCAPCDCGTEPCSKPTA